MSKAEIEFAAENAQKLGDLISRSVALRAIDEMSDIDGAYHAIEKVPAVDTVGVVWCADCAYQETCKRTIEIFPRQDGKGFLHAIVHSCEYGERRADHE